MRRMKKKQGRIDWDISNLISQMVCGYNDDEKYIFRKSMWLLLSGTVSMEQCDE